MTKLQVFSRGTFDVSSIEYAHALTTHVCVFPLYLTVLVSFTLVELPHAYFVQPTNRRLRARTHQLQFRRNGENRKINFSWSLKIGQVADCGDKMLMMLRIHFLIQLIS